MLKLTHKALYEALNMADEIRCLEISKDATEAPRCTFGLVTVDVPRDIALAAVNKRISAAHAALTQMGIELQPGPPPERPDSTSYFQICGPRLLA